MIAALRGFIGGAASNLYLWLMLGVTVLVIASFFKGREHANDQNELEDLREYHETMEEIIAVEPSPNRDMAIERLRSNGLIR